MSLPPDSPKALYHSVPQIQEAASSETEFELDAEASTLAPLDLPSQLVDGRIRWIHFIMGCSVLLPWNVMITATPFFLSRLVGSPLRSTFTSYMSTTFTASNFVFLAHATVTSKATSPSRQTRMTIIWLTVLNSLLTISTFFVPSQGVFFAFVLLNGAAQATAGAYLQTSLVAVASLFGPPAVQAMMSGQAAVAVAVSGVQVISSAASVWGKPRTYTSDGSAEERSAFTFFLLSTLFLVLSYFAHAWLVRMPLYVHVAAPLEQATYKIAAGPANHDEQSVLVSRGRTTASAEKANVLRVAKANMPYEIAVAYVFMATLAVFPPITTSIQSTNPNTHPLLFSALHFLVFNIGDFLGRYACSFSFMLIWSSKRLLSLSVARTLFIPLFLLCNVQRGPTIVPYNPIISSDFLFMLILFAFGWSNGYVSSLCMMAAPSVEHNPRLKGRIGDVDVAATVASFCLVGGLALGSVSSFAVRAVVCNCNPFTE